MTDGLLLSPGAGRRIETAGMTLKVGAHETPRWSMFEAEIGVGFDVGAHLHREAEEVFYVLDGELDLLAFEPLRRTGQDWQTWESHNGTKALRGGPGSAMYVPAGCPHAFANPGPAPARLLFLVAPAGHELYLAEMGELLSSGAPAPEAVAELRLRWDIEQLTPLLPGRRS
ncbi:cupin domain-containing protein [Streptomyces sp. Q6]|uniref:Cupin domain-containing protein n=1 Tax=Streptomyces citrinus TaxID=3118173 RepID=A0ACD5AC01_9ACTN